jgi:adenylyltransferase/sulfurtransferase
MEDFLKTPLETIDKIAPLDQMEVYFICRRGNDSLVSAKALAQAQKENGRSAQLRIKEVRGGVRAWSRTVDPRFPMY